MLIVGLGSVGGVIAAKAAQAGLEVSVLSRTAETLRFEGRDIPLSSCRGSKAKTDAVFFCVNAGDLPAAVKAAKPWIGPSTVVVGLQNGGRRILRDAFGTKRLVEGAVRFGARREAPGHAALVKEGDILLDGPAAPLAAAKSLLERAGLEVTVGRRPSRKE